ncbi:hypothetical protein [Emcibacter sp.]|uniref:hypothetical protein n=1 Tax=Emcibacter sp. TaxID=1979954 RepID=UPI003A912F1D
MEYLLHFIGLLFIPLMILQIGSALREIFRAAPSVLPKQSQFIDFASNRILRPSLVTE